MAISVAKVNRFPVVGGEQGREGVFDITLDNSYPGPGGWPLVAADFGWKGLFTVMPEGPVGGYVAKYNHTTGKLMAFEGDNAAVGSGPLVECQNAAAAMDALVLRVLARGY